MVRDLKAVTSAPDRVELLFGKALTKRNWLAHHYFRERAEDFVSAAGRDHMIAELEEAQSLVREADAELDDVVKPLRIRYGYTDEELPT